MGAVATQQPAVRGDRVRVLPWVLWVLTVAISIAALVLFGAATPERQDLPGYIAFALGALWGPMAGLIGALIASNRRDNRIGWLLLAVGLLTSYVLFTSGAGETEHPAANALNIISDLGWLLFVAAFAGFILLFPDGRLPGTRWRALMWFVAVWPPVFAVLFLIVAPRDLLSDSPASASRMVTGVLLFVTLIAVSASAILRFRRSTGTERQQLKWFAYGTTIGLAAGIFGGVLPRWGPVVSGLGLFGPVAGTAVALFRHRLYDIDELISRTFVYGALLAILAGVATASVRLFNAIFVGVTGLGSEEMLVVTTLILATTIAPIKKRLEEIVEKRYEAPTREFTESDSVDSVSTVDLEARMRAIVREELERAGHAH